MSAKSLVSCRWEEAMAASCGGQPTDEVRAFYEEVWSSYVNEALSAGMMRDDAAAYADLMVNGG